MDVPHSLGLTRIAEMERQVDNSEKLYELNRIKLINTNKYINMRNKHWYLEEVKNLDPKRKEL